MSIFCKSHKLDSKFKRQPPRSILIIVTRRIGDVLLTTPLIHTIKSAWPEAIIDVLVFSNTASALASNPDISRIICVKERPSFTEHFTLLKATFRRYDLAISTLTGDRPTLYAWLAGKCRIGLLENTPKQQWKQKLLHQWLAFDDLHTHTIAMNLTLCKPLGIVPQYPIQLAWTAQQAAHVNTLLDAKQPYVVLHTYPKFTYKMWHDQGWIALIHWLLTHNIQVILTGSSNADEMLYIKNIAANFPTNCINLSGKLSLNETAYLLTHAKAYVGVDTSISHIATAMGTPSIILLGPSNPVKWGGWPKNCTSKKSPWVMTAPSQKSDNVLLLQGLGDCVPCLKEGCDRHTNSESLCLKELPASRVIDGLKNLLTPYI